MRSERSPVPTWSLRSCPCCAVCFCRCASSRRARSSDIARERFLCCERSSWHSTTTPVGMCVMRMAESVLFTCWPPAPGARNGSTRSWAAVLAGALAQHLDLPALAFGVARIHAEEVAREDRGFVATGARADLEEDVG